MGLKDELIKKYIHAPKKMRRVTDRGISGARKLNKKAKKRSDKGKKDFHRRINKLSGIKVFGKGKK